MRKVSCLRASADDLVGRLAAQVVAARRQREGLVVGGARRFVVAGRLVELAGAQPRLALPRRIARQPLGERAPLGGGFARLPVRRQRLGPLRRASSSCGSSRRSSS